MATTRRQLGRGCGNLRAWACGIGMVLGACAPAPGDDHGDDDDARPLVRRGTARAAPTGPVIDPGFVPRPPPGVDVVDVGAIATDESGWSGTVIVDVDDTVTGLGLVIVGDDDAVVVPGRVEAPDGSVVVDDAPVPADTPGLSQARALSRGFTGPFFSPGRVLPARHVGASFVPSTSDLPLAAGPWSIRVGHFAVDVDDAGRPTPRGLGRPVRVFVLLRRVVVAAGRVAVALHFTGGDGLTAATAPSDAGLRTAIDHASRALASGGVALDVGVDDGLDVAEGAALRTVALDGPTCDGGDLDALLRNGVAARVNLYFVERFECGAIGPFLLGLTPGLPAAPWTSSTPSSGVVLATALLRDDPERFGVVVAHELGHALGLFHTQESDGGGGAPLYDNVDDTPDDARAADNLMFFDASRLQDLLLSPGQGLTLQRSPVVIP